MDAIWFFKSNYSKRNKQTAKNDATWFWKNWSKIALFFRIATAKVRVIWIFFRRFAVQSSHFPHIYSNKILYWRRAVHFFYNANIFSDTTNFLHQLTTTKLRMSLCKVLISVSSSYWLPLNCQNVARDVAWVLYNLCRGFKCQVMAVLRSIDFSYFIIRWILRFDVLMVKSASNTRRSRNAPWLMDQKVGPEPRRMLTTLENVHEPQIALSALTVLYSTTS